MVVRNQKVFCLWCVLLCCFGFLFVEQSSADNAQECARIFNEEGDCPKDFCNITCEGGQIFDGCQVMCLPKSCTEITDIEFCPEEDCQILLACNGKE